MKAKLGWILAGLFGLLLVFSWVSRTFFGFSRVGFDRFGSDGMMGGYGMMGHGLGFYSPMGWFGMGLMWLIPLGLLALLIAGAVMIFQALRKAPAAVTASPQAAAPLEVIEHFSCPHCGRSVESDWKTCPYCSESLVDKPGEVVDRP